MLQISNELLIGLMIAVVGAFGTWLTSKANFRAAKQTDLTARYDLLLDNQGKEIARLGTEVLKLREEFKEEQQLTETLKEESSRWRELLQTALAYLRQLHGWRTEGHEPPPPEMPPELMEFLWEDL